MRALGLSAALLAFSVAPVDARSTFLVGAASADITPPAWTPASDAAFIPACGPSTSAIQQLSAQIAALQQAVTATAQGLAGQLATLKGSLSSVQSTIGGLQSQVNGAQSTGAAVKSSASM